MIMTSWEAVERATRGKWVRWLGNINGLVEIRPKCIHPAVNSIMRKY
jgi:hypothetical protein